MSAFRADVPPKTNRQENWMEAIALLLFWCALHISFEVEVSTKRRKTTRRIRIGFGAYTRRPSHVDDDDE
jgi:hypothetical protein